MGVWMKTVVITGADRGCGLALVRCFMEDGWRVYAGQFMPEWKELERLKQEFGSNLILMPLDVGDDVSVQEAAEFVGTREEKIDMLVNVAGIAGGAEDDADVWKQVFQVNVLGPLRMTEAFLPLLRGGKKRICVYSSEAGSITTQPREDGFAYSMSKTAVNMEMRLMFNRLRREGFTFRIYHPGWVRSYMSGVRSKAGVYEPEESSMSAYRQFVTDRSCEDVLLMTDVKDEIWPF